MNFHTKEQIANRIALGTANFGLNYGLVKNQNLFDEKTCLDECHAILDTAINFQIKYIDTAHHYGPSEKIISKFLKKNPDPRIKVISKFIPQNMENESEQSLHEFHDSLHALLWHNFDKNLLPEFESRFLTLKEKHPKLKWGCSTYGIENATHAINTGFFDFVELEFNLLNQWVLKNVQASAEQKQVTLLLRSILQKGFLTHAFQENMNFNLTNDLNKNKQLENAAGLLTSLAKNWESPIEEIAIRYAATVTRNEIIILSAHSPNLLSENLSFLKKGPLSEIQVREINDIASEFEGSLFDLRSWL